MKRLLLPLIVASALHAAHAADTPLIATASLRGTINPASANYLETAIHRAEADHASGLILELDTPGGLVTSVRQMAQAIGTSLVPVIVYVTPAGASATSAGALLMFASHLAAMAPGTNIGAAHPVGPQGEEIKGPMGEKALNDTAAFARGLAELRGRNPEVAEEVVAKSRSFTAQEALKHHLIELVVPDRDALIRALEARKVIKPGASLRLYPMTVGQNLLHHLADPNIAGILMTLGILLLYLEMSHPGIVLPGIFGAISLLVAFMSFALLPIRIGGVALLAIGISLLIAEPFVVAHGAFAAGGVLAFILGLVWVIDPASTTVGVSVLVLLPAAVSLGGMVLLIGLAAARTRGLSRRTLARIGGGSVAGLAGYSGQVESVIGSGQTGKALFRGELWDFRSEQPLKVGDRVEAVRIGGMVVYVRRPA